jgi:hypothetical protein
LVPHATLVARLMMAIFVDKDRNSFGGQGGVG